MHVDNVMDPTISRRPWDCFKYFIYKSTERTILYIFHGLNLDFADDYS